MVRAFSLTSDSLGYFLGYTLFHADRVAIVSPWLSDVDVRLPLNGRLDQRHYRLTEALELLSDTRVTVVVKTGEEHNDYVRTRLPELTEFIELDDLHAKAIVCDEYVYLGSANITHGGLNVNRELCEVLENEYGDTRAFLREELQLNVD